MMVVWIGGQDNVNPLTSMGCSAKIAKKADIYNLFEGAKGRMSGKGEKKGFRILR